jgi:hypothetical protein
MSKSEPALPLQCVDLRDQGDPALLAEVYSQLYLPHFTIAEEQETLEQYSERLYGAQADAPQPETHIAVAGEHLDE